MALAMRFDSALAMLEQTEQDARADTAEELADVLWNWRSWPR
jgi:hypothetical protein